MGNNLYEAFRQWAERPADQRFWDFPEMFTACEEWKNQAAEAHPLLTDLRVTTGANAELLLQGSNGGHGRLLHFSFGQLSQLAKFPAGPLRSLPPGMVADVLNEKLDQRIAKKDEDARLNVLMRQRNGGYDVRAITSENYGRIWNADVIRFLTPLRDRGWVVPPARPATGDDPRARPATEEDCLRNRGGGLSINPGDTIAPAGLYASDKDCFIFMVNEDRAIEVDGKPLYRGFFVKNSEIGDGALKITMFLYNLICGNHIVWNVADVKEVKIVHRGRLVEGKARAAFKTDLQSWEDRDTTKERELIATAKKTIIGKDADELVERLFDKKIATKTSIIEAYAVSEKHVEDHGSDPRSAWGMINGFTRASQESTFADRRVEMDRAAGKILQVSF